MREQVRLQEALQALGFSSSAAGLGGSTSGFTHLPPSVQARLAQAAVTGFHDTIWLLVALSGVGLLLAFLLRDRPASKASTTIEVIHG